MLIQQSDAELMRGALNSLSMDAQRVVAGLYNVRPLPVPIPETLAEWSNATGRLMDALHPSKLAEGAEQEVSEIHARRLRTAVALKRRMLAEDVSTTQRVLHDGNVRAGLETQYAELDRLLSGQLAAIRPLRRPRLSDYLTPLGLEESSDVQTLSAPEFDPKHRMLLSSSLLEHDTRVYREQCDSRDCALAVVFADLDDFKAINTQLGEVSVDRVVLPQVLRAIEVATYGHGRAYRFGGDEFVLLLPNATSVSASNTAQRMSAALRGLPMPAGVTSLGVSVGIWVGASESHLTGTELVHLASEAKQKAKNAGKRCIVVRSEEGSAFSEEVVRAEA